MAFDNASRRLVREIDDWVDGNLARLSQLVETNYVGRPNELGNYLEAELIELIDRECPLECRRPTTAKGTAQTVGYPDAIVKQKDIILYCEVKTYQEKTKETTLRTFYYQPTNQSKIQQDAPHFLIGFQTESINVNNRSPFKVVDYAIRDVYNLQVQFKAEFNANNRTLYNLKKP